MSGRLTIIGGGVMGLDADGGWLDVDAGFAERMAS